VDSGCQARSLRQSGSAAVSAIVLRIGQELKKRSDIEKYLPAIGETFRDILQLLNLE